jgi:hypothetical protein
MLSQLPSARFFPIHYKTGGLGNWSGHLPFSRDLIGELEPSVIVELGSQYGESYFGFCQAVVESGISAKTFAVDTWLGDRHTGAYGEEVFESVRRSNERHYAGFSRLLRMTFDEAAPLFTPDSVDLLHIDGLHEYAAVRHDFETWFPKVRPGGIVLLHDIAMQTGDFGVWKLWEELSAQYPAFGFTHSCGLGVIQKPGLKPGISSSGPFFRALFGDRSQDGIRAYYELCADRLEWRYKASLANTDAVFQSRIQLYWRQAGQSFAEDRSIPVWRPLGSNCHTVVFDLPSINPSVVELRLDLAGESAIFRLGGISLSDRESGLIWSPELHSFAANPRRAGVQMSQCGEELLLNLTDTVCSISLPINEEILSRLIWGGRLELNISAVSHGAAVALLMSHRLPEAVQSGGGQNLIAERPKPRRKVQSSA